MVVRAQPAIRAFPDIREHQVEVVPVEQQVLLVSHTQVGREHQVFQEAVVQREHLASLEAQVIPAFRGRVE